MSIRRAHVALLAILALLAASSPARADDPAPAAGGDPTLIRAFADVDVSANGDAKWRVEMHFHPDTFQKVKAVSPDPRKFLQDMKSGRADYEVAPGAEAAYATNASAVILSVTELAAAKNRGGGRWEIPLEAGYSLAGKEEKEEGGVKRFVFKLQETEAEDGGVKLETVAEIRLPAGARDPAFDAEGHVLSWTLPFTGGTGPGAMTATLRAKDRLMASIYKVYGMGVDFAAQFVAKTVLKNTGTNVVRNVRVRYRLQGYSEWSPWDKFPEVVPGQTIVSLYYPVLEASVARLRSNTPANVLVEWSYEDADGKKHEDDDAKKIVLLGVNEYVFSNLSAAESFGTWAEASNNAPLLAAWVSRNDAVVKEFAAMANKNAGGAGASTDDKTAVAVLRACYEILRANDFTYQHPPALSDKQLSFDIQMVQNVKFPRDVIRDRSGTCIDLAILYASMVNAVGLEPHLALIPGHCFPVVRLPSGQLVGVEATGVAGGLRFGSAGFEKMLEVGIEELRKASEDGRIQLIDVRGLWTRGVANPELEELPADILGKWGITGEGRGQPAPDAAAGAKDVVGQWVGTLSEKLKSGETITYPFIIGIDRVAEGKYHAGSRIDAKVQGENGEVALTLVETYDGEVKDGTLVLVSTERKASANGGEPQDAARTASVLIQFDGDDLVGKMGSDAEGWQPFRLKRKE